jgi:hypothetical protein
MWKCAKAELHGQIRCFPNVELSDVPRLQQVSRFRKIAIIKRPLSTYCDTIHTDLKHEIVSNMLVHENFINEQEENSQ